jgi:predicted component of type VI protein secretion system
MVGRIARSEGVWAGASMKSELVPLNGDPPIPITRDLTVVGRREYCDVRIGHESLSKRHCVLVRTDGLLMLRDLASTNGTKVNGQRVMWAALLPNDRLTLGRYKCRVYLGPDDVPSPSESTFTQAVTSLPTAGAALGAGVAVAGAAGVGFAASGPPPSSEDIDILDGNDLLIDDSDDEPVVIELD